MAVGSCDGGALGAACAMKRGRLAHAYANGGAFDCYVLVLAKRTAIGSIAVIGSMSGVCVPSSSLLGMGQIL